MWLQSSSRNKAQPKKEGTKIPLHSNSNNNSSAPHSNNTGNSSAPGRTTKRTSGGRIAKSPQKRTVQDGKPCRFMAWRTFQREQFAKHFDELFKDVWFGDDGPDKKLIQQLQEQIIGRTVGDVDFLIKNHCQKIKLHRHKTYGPIDKWLEMVESLSVDADVLGQQLGHVMLAAQQEPIAGEDQMVGIDQSMPQPNYDNLYHYLACAAANRELPELSPIDSLVIEDCFQSSAFQIKCLKDDELRRSLRKVFIHLTTSPQFDQEEDSEEIRKNMLHNTTVINPLGINSQAIMPVPPE